MSAGARKLSVNKAAGPGLAAREVSGVRIARDARLGRFLDLKPISRQGKISQAQADRAVRNYRSKS